MHSVVSNSVRPYGLQPTRLLYPRDFPGKNPEVGCHFLLKLEVVKQEMARVNINVLVISELKWTGMCEFNSDDHYIYYFGPESLRRNGVAIMVKKSLKCSTWMQSQKQKIDLCLFPMQTIHHHSNPSLCPN